MSKDYYAILGVPRGAPDKEVKSSYRKLARKYHPDVNPNDKTAEARFKEISEAYSVLSDPDKRKAYDQFGPQWEQAQHFQGQNPGDFGQDVTFNFGGGNPFENLFEQFMGGRGGFHVDQFTDMPHDVEKVVEITLEEVDSGARRVLSYQTMDAVKTREGVTTVPTNKRVEVKIPAGIGEGKRLRVPGKGVAGANGKAGDLYVTVKWAPHEKFKPVGDHLEVEVPTPFTIAALGGEIRIPTLRGAVKMRIPEGSHSGQMFRLAGQGVMRLNGGRGDLMVRIKVTVPKPLSSEQRKLIEELAKLEAAAS